MIDLGDVVPLTFRVVTTTEALVNADTVALTITLPDLTTVSPSITNPPASLGSYTYDYTATQVGRYTARWVSTGPSRSTFDAFNVADTSLGPIVSLAAVKLHLNMDEDRIDDDEELRGVICAATPIVEDVVDVVAPRSFSEVRAAGSLLMLNHRPVISLTSLVSVKVGGTSYAVADLDLDAETGIIRRLDGARFWGPLRATYLAGRRVVSANIQEGAKEIIRHAWETQRGHSSVRPGFGEEQDLAPTPSGFLVPRRAMEWLRPHARAPMMA